MNGMAWVDGETYTFVDEPVISCTTALFLSGYVIQQRTVSHLRAAIRPDSSPQLYLPDRFRDDTTELEDGTIVMLDEYNRPVRLKSGRISIGKGPQVTEEVGGAEPLGDGSEAVEIQVPETLPDVLDGPEQQIVMASEEAAAAREGPGAHDDAQQEIDQDPPPPQPKEAVEVQARPQASPWEVRSEDLPGEGPVENDPEKDEKPISRAERRRLIKEEIQRLSQGETPIYYQRRLW